MGRNPKSIGEVDGKIGKKEREFRESVEPRCLSRKFEMPDGLEVAVQKEFKNIVSLINEIENHPASDVEIPQIVDLSKWIVYGNEAEKRWRKNGCRRQVMTATKIDKDGISKGMELRLDEDYQIMLDCQKVVASLRKQLALDIFSRAKIGTILNNNKKEQDKISEYENYGD